MNRRDGKDNELVNMLKCSTFVQIENSAVLQNSSDLKCTDHPGRVTVNLNATVGALADQRHLVIAFNGC